MAHFSPPSPTKVNDGAGDQPAVVTVQRHLMAFVGRLQKDTTEKQLCSWLVAVGIQGVKCKKLVSKDGKQFNTAAFFVSCVAVSKDLFYNEQVVSSETGISRPLFHDESQSDCVY